MGRTWQGLLQTLRYLTCMSGFLQRRFLHQPVMANILHSEHQLQSATSGFVEKDSAVMLKVSRRERGCGWPETSLGKELDKIWWCLSSWLWFWILELLLKPRGGGTTKSTRCTGKCQGRCRWVIKTVARTLSYQSPTVPVYSKHIFSFVFFLGELIEIPRNWVSVEEEWWVSLVAQQ